MVVEAKDYWRIEGGDEQAQQDTPSGVRRLDRPVAHQL
jgi:hypothetical protein